ncbi:MAG: hypothetical protein KDA27_21125 [Candidatus Eisenbacteria bacterium]|uniref:Porin n=1 Tax=Eiseniibacteriota bacterium TaxID=2212470 RepID=A0A956NH23_UNCEI|nr:hypothetical protein [Candidatus Eisenbacteria bacterium]
MSPERNRRRVATLVGVVAMLFVAAIFVGAGVAGVALAGSGTALAESDPGVGQLPLTEGAAPTPTSEVALRLEPLSGVPQSSSVAQSFGGAQSPSVAQSSDGAQMPKEAPPKKTAKKSKKKRPFVTVSGTFALEFIYDDNIIHYSDDDLDQFSSEPNSGKFRIESADDFIVRPRLDLTFESRELTGKPFSARLRYSSWRYVENGIKNNESYSVLLKHSGFARDNFQLSLYYAPMSYLRHFLDRPPMTPGSEPSQYTRFSYASNTASLAWWKKWTNRVDTKLTLGRSARYYNRPFMENDNWEWRIGGYVAWKPHPRLKTQFEYFYSDVEARALDTVGETVETSDDGDASYERDSYDLSLTFSPKGGMLKVSSLSLSGQYQAYYFTSAKPYFEDPYHVGRKDQVYRMELSARSVKLYGPVRLESGYRYTERTSSAAFDSGDASIGEDKDYTDNRVWLGVEYPF